MNVSTAGDRPAPGRPVPGRPVARGVVCLAILLLGGVAALRLELSYLPTWTFPELIVDLRLPEMSEIDDLTRRYIQPLESSIRAVGETTSVAGEVYTSGGWFRVRFRAGTDAERKAARLESELAFLRRELPRGALTVRPVGQGGGEQSVVLWVDRSADAPLGSSFVEAVRSLAEVRSVEVAGEDLRELRVTSRGIADPSTLRRALEGRLAVRRLGEARTGGRRVPVRLAGDAAGFDELTVRHGNALLPLDALAEARFAAESARWIVHRQGQRGLVLLIDREYEASPLALERALTRLLERFGLTGRYDFIVNEAEPLEQLLWRLLLGFVVAVAVVTVLAAVLGGPRAAASQLLALPVALAAALNAFWLAGVSLDVTTLPMLAMALGWCLFFPAFRSAGQGLAAAATMAAAAAIFPVAVALAGGRLGPLLLTPAKAFLVASLAGLVALSVLPLPPAGRFLGLTLPRWLPPLAVGRPLRAALRNPWTVLLGTATGSYALFVLFGSALEPRSGRLSPAVADLGVELRFAEGTTPEQAEAQISLAEEELSESEEIVHHSSVFNDRWGRVDAKVRPEDRRLPRLRRLAARLQLKLNDLGSSVRVVPLASGAGRGDEPVRFTDSLEDRPEADRDLTFYRFVLRSTDLDLLRDTHTKLVELLTRIWLVTRRQIQSDWGRPAVRLELVPKPGVTPAEAAAAAAAISRHAFLPPRRELPSASEVGLRVVDPGAPRTRDEVPQRTEILGLQQGPSSLPGAPGVVVPGALVDVREVIVSPSVKRQSGRYVLPVTVRFAGSPVRNYEARDTVNKYMQGFTLPAGCDVELPELNVYFWGPERLRMVAIALTLPLLLLALAICCLDSIPRALVALAPLVVGLAAAAPWIRASTGHVDEMTLFALAAMAAGALPLAVLTVAARGPGGAQDYRWLAGHSLGLLIAVAGLACLLAVPGLGVDGDRHPWSQPLSVAAAAGAFSCLGSYFCVPGLLRSAAHWRSRRERRARRRATHEAWRAEGPLELSARGLTKVYGDGFKALAGVDFRLEPGIIGLLGPNGAGKTTLLRTLCGLLEPTRGQVCYRGLPITPDNLPVYRRMVGFLPQEFNAYAGFTGAQFLDYWALEKGIRDPRRRREEVERWLAQMGLEEAAGRKVRSFSGGMRRRIGIARALVGDPPIVIVDEPTTGLDVSSRNQLRESLLAVAGERVILFSTHIASDVAAAAARILLLHQGRLLYDGPAKGLVAKARGSVFETMIDDDELREFAHRYRVTTRVRTLDGIRVRAVASDEGEPPGRVVEPNLEEAYLSVIGGESWKRQRGRVTGSLLDLDSWRRVG